MLLLRVVITVLRWHGRSQGEVGRSRGRLSQPRQKRRQRKGLREGMEKRRRMSKHLYLAARRQLADGAGSDAIPDAADGEQVPGPLNRMATEGTASPAFSTRVARTSSRLYLGE